MKAALGRAFLSSFHVHGRVANIEMTSKIEKNLIFHLKIHQGLSPANENGQWYEKNPLEGGVGWTSTNLSLWKIYRKTKN